MSIFVAGIGAVSPAGWGVHAIRSAIQEGSAPLPEGHMLPGLKRRLQLRTVPAPDPRPAWLSHPRLRRASPLSQYVAGAAMEALGDKVPLLNQLCLTLITCLQSGPVQYACRFYGEVLKDPSQASPLLFPETVFSAPASHLATLLGMTPRATTFLGDPGTFLQALAYAANWLVDGKTDLCLILGAEEFNWTVANASWHLDHHSVLAAGAGAVLLSADPAHSIGPRLECVTDPHTYSPQMPVPAAAAAMRAQLPQGGADDLLVDGLGGAYRVASAEEKTWRDWQGWRMSPKRVLGEGLLAGSAWQCVLAADAIVQKTCPAASVSVVGCNQQAIGARFRAES